MADTYEKDLGAKSAITSSDYIRVVGSDNVSYKQPMSFFPTKAEVNALNNKFLIQGATSSEVTISANNRATVQIPCAVSGYTPVGILGIYVPETDVFTVSEFYIGSGNNAMVVLTNSYNDTRSSTITVRILYMAS